MTERIWAPWRMPYITGAEKEEGCIFCAKPSEKNDRENLVLRRGKTCFAIMNRYPYTNGHIMVVPYRHTCDPTELAPEETAEIGEEVKLFIGVLKRVMNPDGFNVGMNVGRSAGAGIDAHLHMHVVPRWAGDSNFMSVTGGTRVISESLSDTYDKIKKALSPEENSCG